MWDDVGEAGGLDYLYVLAGFVTMPDLGVQATNATFCRYDTYEPGVHYK